jgi:hypothetical protein
MKEKEKEDGEIKSVMSKEDKAFLMRALWKALQAPQWTKDDLILFGKTIYSKQTLAQMPEKTFDTILPFLSTITESLGEQLSKAAEVQGKKAVEGETAVADDAETKIDDEEEEEGGKKK